MQSAEKKIRPPVRPGLVVSPSAELQAQRLRDWQHSLVGKFIDELIPSPSAAKEAVAELWKPTGSLVTIPYQRDRYVFKLSSLEDKERIIAGGPYIVERKLLALQTLPPGTPVDQVRFSRVPVWITLSGIPMDFCYPEMALALAEAAGQPTEADVVMASDSGPGNVRVRVEIEAEEPLLKGSYLDNCNGSMLWIAFEYEGIPRICRNCMFIGHLEAECQKSNIQAKYLLTKRLHAIAEKMGVPIVNDPAAEGIFVSPRSRSVPPTRSVYSRAGAIVPAGEAAAEGTGLGRNVRRMTAEKAEEEADDLLVLPLSGPTADLSGLEFLEPNPFDGGHTLEPDQAPRGGSGKRKHRSEKAKK